ncbi:MAG TPA: hypothetical protein DDX29_01310 [Clostridiales bacterium]|nr:hypothetical protein [Clostridiales bacterium]
MIQCYYCKRQEKKEVFFNTAEEYIQHLKVCSSWAYELKHPNEGRVRRLSAGVGREAGQNSGKLLRPPARSPKPSFLTSLIMCVKCFIHNRQHCGN